MDLERNGDESVAIGVKVFDRTDRLRALFESIPAGEFSTVYIADDGPPAGKAQRRTQLYDGEYPFDLEVLGLEYDTGLGYGRHRIVEASDEEYLLMLDSDNHVPNNVSVLLELMNHRSDLGAVSGCLAEPTEHRITMMGADFGERDGTLLLSPYLHEKEVEFVEGYPLLEFDLIANVGLFRRECLEDYSWDPNSIQPFDHEDFFIAHWKQTDWSFASCPQVVIPHYPGGDNAYLSRRWRDRDEAEQYFLQKWNYDAFKADRYSWLEGGRPNSVTDRAKQIYFQDGVLALARRSLSFIKRLSG
ncbi:glycosyltransferase family A protein [Natronobeatus ordinarius]|uniref:glycosyltransferase family A protein n=1 Tax=Natronobeatus ordinarius TaxID=2963433 RepID=UPI0020CE36FC|nr:glycosyltransferase family A protein [Natronobeatus ordinarius]